MIYYASLFFNELDLLDLKIREESPYVDKMFIVESELSFTGNQKSVNYPKGKYDNYKNVEHVLLKESFFPKGITAWEREHVQRNAIRSLVGYNDDDIWIVTDIDEIIVGKNIPMLVEETAKHGHICIGMQIYYYYINALYPRGWDYPFMCTGKVARGHDFQDIVKRRGISPEKIVTNCGKHFSYLGSPADISLKLKSFSHTEYSTPYYSNEHTIKDRIANLEDVCGRKKVMKVVPIDSSYPQTILDDLPAWEKYIYKEAVVCQT